MDDRQAVEPSQRATPAPGREFSFMEQLIGNFGRFSNAPDSKNGNVGRQ
jgi:hypothetical protein